MAARSSRKKGKTPPEALAAYVDKSVPNLSSIVVLAEVGGKTMLLTGDARGDKILKGSSWWPVESRAARCNVDLLKVPHHGSANNLDNDFFERIIAKHYVFSGDGEHGNPERESLEMLLDARGRRGLYDPSHLSDRRDRRGAQGGLEEGAGQGKEEEDEESEAKGAAQLVQDEAQPACLLRRARGLEEKVAIVDEDKPHLIDLLDKVKF